jgi:hypothetical protein
MNHLHMKMWTHIVLIWGVFIWNLTTYWKIKYHNLQLYKLKLYLRNHIIEDQFVGVFLL